MSSMVKDVTVFVVPDGVPDYMLVRMDLILFFRSVKSCSAGGMFFSVMSIVNGVSRCSFTYFVRM